MTRDDRHPGAERLAEYAEGVLASADRAAVEHHLAECADCRAVVAETVTFMAAEQGAIAPEQVPRVVPFRRSRWLTGVAAGLAMAAALVLAVRVVPPAWLGFGPGVDRPELQELVAAVANEPTRPLEGRLTGGFSYGPPPAPKRSAQPAGSEARLSAAVEDQAAVLAARAQTDLSPAAQAAFGVSALIKGQFDVGIAAIESAVRAEPANALFLTDLSAGYLQRGRFRGVAADFARALDAADRARRSVPTQKEASFNRALALEGLGRRFEARSAWESYRELDPTGPWYEEAVRHLARLLDKSAHMRVQSVVGLRSQIGPQLMVNLGTASSDFPASFWSPDAQCTATLIGGSVVLTAAHCLTQSPWPITLMSGDGLQSFDGVCDMAPGFGTVNGHLVQDWALCKMQGSPSVQPEVVNTDATLVQTGAGVEIAGYGCDFSSGINIAGSVFEVGWVTVADPALDGTDVFTTMGANGTFLCPGDSGGGTYAPVPGGRVEVGVNSMTDFSSTSLVSSLASNAGRSFLFEWSECHRLTICGVDPAAPNCRIPMPAGNVPRVPMRNHCPAGW